MRCSSPLAQKPNFLVLLKSLNLIYLYKQYKMKLELEQDGHSSADLKALLTFDFLYLVVGIRKWLHYLLSTTRRAPLKNLYSTRTTPSPSTTSPYYTLLQHLNLYHMIDNTLQSSNRLDAYDLEPASLGAYDLEPASVAPLFEYVVPIT
ncbi:hypothetical protein B296_00000182 [Ensete ventricosum]|uniref:Uncharacterized protein n=1 Tax=Ensete ventricosum TaxID=4639 RepID=A0A426ZMJ3_ENSVE|nr:hypothetical protein B296_00000182 [Ensete ventricosum]